MSNKKYVIYIGAMVMPDKNAGAQRAMSLCKTIKECGYTPIIIGLHDADYKCSILESEKVFQGVTTYSLSYPSALGTWLKRMTSISDFITVMKKYGLENIHSIIAIDYEIIALYRLKNFCKKHNIFLVADNMEWYEKSDFMFPKNLVKDMDTYLRMKVFYPKLKNKICISKFLYDYYKDKPSDSNICKIPVTIDFEEEKWKNLNTNGDDRDYKVIAYAGNPGPHCIKERLDWLIQAVCEMNRMNLKCRLKVIGIDSDWFEQQYPELCEDPYYSNIIYFGKLPHTECLAHIADADAFAIIREDRLVTKAGFPTKLSEGLGCGTPAFITPSSNLTEYVFDGKNGFVTDGFEYEDIKNTLLRIMKLSSVQLKEMKAYCKREKALDYRDYIDEMKEFFENMTD